MRTNICTALKKTEGEERGEKNEGAWESSLKQDSSSISTPEVLPISLNLIFNPLSLALPFALPSNSKQNKSRKSRNFERQWQKNNTDAKNHVSA
ncbi:hypothetical protein OIU74_009540 [Salix koriyanagi]|uniref:Uncharacterized protein n=1 Tax=Salix koriyanagi TaxID=2511006 RepID=A0A9Q0TSI2_9ROSI|nr:hypothetical protein OIU74_009540 [Salix koriyanagi]